MSFLFDNFEGMKIVKNPNRPIPVIPHTGWKPRRHYPDLSGAKIIALDCETKELDFDNGPGWARGKGHIVGISIATDNGFSGYYPIRHELGSEDNLPVSEVLGWVSRELGRKSQVKVGANVTYDIGWLQEEGVEVSGLILDVQFAEALLDPGARVALERLGRKYVGEGKDSQVMYKWIMEAYGCSEASARGFIYCTPPSLVGFYAESDAVLPLQIIQKQWPELVRKGLTDVMYMECKLIPLMIKMRRAGVTVDLKAANKADDNLSQSITKMNEEIRSQVGFSVNTSSGKDLALAFDRLGLSYGKTEAGNPSFTADFLAGMHHPFAKLVTELKSYEKIQSTFIRGYILGKNINGKLHGQFHQMRGDNGGTVAGRFSSSDPNLQNIPSRHPVLGKLVRDCFVPDHGHKQWRKYDYAQIEYRFMAHFAVGPGAEELREIFAANPKADYHNVMVDIIKQASGHVIDRKPAKTINFGLLYGMMLKALASKLAMTPEQATPILNAYHQGAPFIKATMDFYEEQCYDKGYVETIMGRKTWFNLWVPKRGGFGMPGLTYSMAKEKYRGPLKLQDTHKAINRVLQGSSADQMKAAMLKMYEDGLFDYIGVPRMTIHDELDFSDTGETDDGFLEVQRIMQDVIPLKVPILADADIGPSWGTLTEAS